MKDGRCGSCNSDKVYAQENGFSHGKGFQVVTGFRQVYEMSKTATIDFVCVNCGYFQQYISDKSTLRSVSEKWEKVPVLGD